MDKDVENVEKIIEQVIDETIAYIVIDSSGCQEMTLNDFDNALTNQELKEGSRVYRVSCRGVIKSKIDVYWDDKHPFNKGVSR